MRVPCTVRCKESYHIAISDKYQIWTYRDETLMILCRCSLVCIIATFIAVAESCEGEIYTKL